MSGLLERFQQSDRQALARILTHVENQTELGHQALSALSRHEGNAHLIGITGPPGAGKSTLANALVKELRERNESVAVLAIDPTSPFTGGATLGDRIRMLESQDDDGVYLRSMASRGQVGGLTLAAFGAALVLDAFGFDYIIIETVGSGQDEVDIARLADTVLVVQTPGMGDSIQAVKAGILEIADILLVNKADNPGSAVVVRDLRNEIRRRTQHGWEIPVLPVVSISGEGVPKLVDAISEHQRHLLKQNGLEEKKRQRTTYHARMIALRELSRFIDSSFNAVDDVSDATELAQTMIDSFIKARTSHVYGSLDDRYDSGSPV